jgi:isocitrate/isopropylmalate dehydrogenase
LTARKVAVVPGDGIGPEVVAETVRVLRHLGGVELEELPWGADYYLRTGVTVPPGGYDTLRSFAMRATFCSAPASSSISMSTTGPCAFSTLGFVR